MKAIVFGAAVSSQEYYDEIKKRYDIVAYCDNDPAKWGTELNHTPVIAPKEIGQYQWDEIIIVSLTAMDAIRKQLLGMEEGGGVPENSINTSYVEYKIRAREAFVRDYATIIRSSPDLAPGICVAEAGVFQGEFAKVINESFPDSKLYLFDTFTGFDKRDVKYEKAYGFSEAAEGDLCITSEELVLNKMKYPERCRIRKGYFPESADGIEESFCFVNLDMDLYKPTLEGLRFFYPLLIQGGIIMVHDYFTQGYEGVNAALKDFIAETDPTIIPFPVGDHHSIAIQKR